MKTHTFSIVVGTGACNIKCPYCVSKMTCQARKSHDINWLRFDIACRMVLMARDGLVNAMFTGTGEPCLYPDDITAYLNAMQKRFPLVTLQTNGTLLKESKLKQWADAGLTAVCFSVAALSPHTSNQIMKVGEAYKDFNYWDKIKMVQDLGLMVRINCTMLRVGVHKPAQVEDFVNECRERGVVQLTLREVDMPDNAADSEVVDYVKVQKPHGAAEKLYYYLVMNGAHVLQKLPHGGTVFDYRGQNVCISNCLTDKTDPNDIRQIIFYPNGDIGYDWKYKGARIL
jgi:molybdenum cofactor biosynthesis enzyme MoaA